ncbi:MAG: YggS family pyridoxal phosphate-dependent enzyme [Oligoflexia bacterium]|nr:YggS family pyridoxal phosphate-dependent enzyme [Oligoflexia bacterium]
MTLNENLKNGAGVFVESVIEKIAAAEAKAKRSTGSVTLIAVSKTKSADLISKVADKGVVHFGENYVQEATKKIDKLKQNHPNLKWHLIGSLQTNKSKFVVGKFETIQSVDRFELAKALNQRAKEADLVQKILIQVKLGEEPTKGGITPELLPELISKISEFKNLKLQGLMTLPPLEVDPETSRKYFIQLRELRDKNAKLVTPQMGSFEDLSMGTTHDYEVAIEEGATMVRVGTAIFGGREFGD